MKSPEEQIVVDLQSLEADGKFSGIKKNVFGEIQKGRTEYL